MRHVIGYFAAIFARVPRDANVKLKVTELEERSLLTVTPLLPPAFAGSPPATVSIAAEIDVVDAAGHPTNLEIVAGTADSYGWLAIYDTANQAYVQANPTLGEVSKLVDSQDVTDYGSFATAGGSVQQILSADGTSQIAPVAVAGVTAPVTVNFDATQTGVVAAAETVYLGAAAIVDAGGNLTNLQVVAGITNGAGWLAVYDSNSQALVPIGSGPGVDRLALSNADVKTNADYMAQGGRYTVATAADGTGQLDPVSTTVAAMAPVPVDLGVDPIAGLAAVQVASSVTTDSSEISVRPFNPLEWPIPLELSPSDPGPSYYEQLNAAIAIQLANYVDIVGDYAELAIQKVNKAALQAQYYLTQNAISANKAQLATLDKKSDEYFNLFTENTKLILANIEVRKSINALDLTISQTGFDIAQDLIDIQQKQQDIDALNKLIFDAEHIV